MKTKLFVGLLVSAMILPSFAAAQAESVGTFKKPLPAAPTSSVKTEMPAAGAMMTAELKVGFIDTFGAMREAQEGVGAAEVLEQKRKELAKNIEVKAQLIAKLDAELTAKAGAMNASARAKKEQEIAREKRDYSSLLQESEEAMKLAMNDVTEALAKEVEKSMIEVAKREGLDVVLDMSGRVVYFNGKGNYTEQVVKGMNKSFSQKVAKNEKTAASVVTLASNAAPTPKKNSAAAAAA